MSLNIIFSGLGAMGGYYGAQAAKIAEELDGISVHYFMRENEHGLTVKNKGIHVISPSLDFYAHPSSVCFDPSDLPEADVLVLGTKGYDTLNNLDQLKSVITKDTIIVTTQNGVLIPEEVKKLYPDNLIVGAACHITGRRTEPGLINIRSDRNVFKFGPYLGKGEVAKDWQISRLEVFYLLLKAAGVSCKLYPESHQLLNDKFIMLSPSAAATAYFDTPVGIVMQEHSSELKSLIEELLNLYKAMDAPTESHDVEKVYSIIDKMPKEATTSMHSDIAAGHNSELELLVGYVVKKAKALGIDTPTYQRFYEAICKRIS